jgi:Rieske Fe-S protein
MSLNRREFVILTCAMTAGCAASQTSENVPVQLREVSIDAGPVTNFAADGVYDRFRDRGFFIVRHGQTLEALSAICTHRKCKVKVEPNDSFYCKCHGSRFDPDGRVTEGPATQNLPVLPTSISENGHLLVHAVAV